MRPLFAAMSFLEEKAESGGLVCKWVTTSSLADMRPAVNNDMWQTFPKYLRLLGSLV